MTAIHQLNLKVATHYDVLGVAPETNLVDTKIAADERRRQIWEDRTLSNEQKAKLLIAVETATNVLLNPEEREAYNEALGIRGVNGEGRKKNDQKELSMPSLVTNNAKEETNKEVGFVYVDNRPAELKALSYQEQQRFYANILRRERGEKIDNLLLLYSFQPQSAEIRMITPVVFRGVMYAVIVEGNKCTVESAEGRPGMRVIGGTQRQAEFGSEGGSYTELQRAA